MTKNSDQTHSLPKKVSRRSMLKSVVGGTAGAAAIGSGLVVSGISQQANANIISSVACNGKAKIEHGQFDTVVIGAGLSGLATAQRLKEKGKRVLILESRNRVGGRVQTFNSPGQYKHVNVDGGAEFIGDPQLKMMELATRYNLQTVDTPNKGNNVYYRRGYAQKFSANGLIGAVPYDWSILESGIMQEMLNKEAKRFPVGKPWLHPEAEKYDNITFEDWISSKTMSEPTRFIFRLLCSSTLSVSAKQISALFMFNYVAAAGHEELQGKIDVLINVKYKENFKSYGGAQQYLIEGGSEQFAWAMLSEFMTGSTTKPATKHFWDESVIPDFATSNSRLFVSGNQALQLDSPVRKITKDKNTGRLTIDSDRLSIVSDHVVIAMSPTVARNIEFSPALPPGKMQMQDHMPMGSICKVMVYYDRPFWRDRGFTGQVISDLSNESGPIDVTYDNSPVPSAELPNPPGIIIGFISAEAMREIDNLTDVVDQEADASSAFYSEVRRRSIASLVKYFGNEMGEHNVRDFAFNRWDDEVWTRGGPTSVAGPGVITSFWEKHLRSANGNIHWAGTETSDYWTGYMEGAIRAGIRAADEIA